MTVSIIIPSIGRKSLKRSLESVVNQKNEDWICHVGFDGLTKNQVNPDILVDDPRINYHYLEKKLGKLMSPGESHNSGGRVRNRLIEEVTTDWIGFLDDDDTLHQNYVSSLKYHIKNSDSLDFLVYRMIYPNGKLIPNISTTSIDELVVGNVGINFAARNKFLIENNIQFINSETEDHIFLSQIIKNNGTGKITEEVLYRVSH